MSPNDVDPQTEELWTAEIERRAREVVEGKVTLLDADEVHADAARLLRARAGLEMIPQKGGNPIAVSAIAQVTLAEFPGPWPVVEPRDKRSSRRVPARSFPLAHVI
jgi:hypothetical protein